MLSGAPFKRLDREGRQVADRRGEMVRLMGASHDILNELVTTDHFRGSSVVGFRPSIRISCSLGFEAHQRRHGTVDAVRQWCCRSTCMTQPVCSLSRRTSRGATARPGPMPA